MRPWRFLSSVAFVAAALVLSGCATNTMTGRKQLSLVSEQSVARQSLSYYSAMESDARKKQKLIDSGPLKERVEIITNRLIEQAVLYRPDSRDWNWQVLVIDEPKTVNAFCMPGGLMGIYTGMFEKLQATDDEVAQVMGHEIGHALAGHGAEKMSTRIAANMAAIVIAAAISNNSRDFNNNQQAMLVGATTFVTLPNSRETESEADRIGIELAARAGYNPQAAVTLWQKMATLDRGNTPAFMRTHPTSEARAQDLKTLGPPMEKLHSHALAHMDEKPPFDWLKGPREQRPAVDPSQAIALYSPAWERFIQGEAELKGNNVLAYQTRKGGLKEVHDKKQWRDLAVQVMEADFRLDLNYLYLGRAAQGLGHAQAAQRYMGKALELSETEDGACAKRTFVGCSGVDVRSGATESR